MPSFNSIGSPVDTEEVSVVASHSTDIDDQSRPTISSPGVEQIEDDEYGPSHPIAEIGALLNSSKLNEWADDEQKPSNQDITTNTSPGVELVSDEDGPEIPAAMAGSLGLEDTDKEKNEVTSKGNVEIINLDEDSPDAPFEYSKQLDDKKNQKILSTGFDVEEGVNEPNDGVDSSSIPETQEEAITPNDEVLNSGDNRGTVEEFHPDLEQDGTTRPELDHRQQSKPHIAGAFLVEERSVYDGSVIDETVDEPVLTRWKERLVCLGISSFAVLAVVLGVTLLSPNKPQPSAESSTTPTPSDGNPTNNTTTDSVQYSFDIRERLANITPGGIDALSDESTHYHRAWIWLVHDDRMGLSADSNHLHQRYVLMLIYFNAGPWTSGEGQMKWGSAVHECEWEGVFCKYALELEQELGGQVEYLLEVGRDDEIKIDVPDRVVSRLELSQRFSGREFPDDLSLLYYLQHLDLERNGLVGTLPQTVYELINLQTLFLEGNELSNIDSISKFHYLEQLSLSRNAFRGQLPESFKNLKGLKSLYLHTNRFTGQIFDIIKDFISLELLDIAYNEFNGTIPSEIGNMKNVTSLFLGHNNFQGSIPREIEMCKQLRQFQMDGCSDMGGPVPSEIGSLEQLEFLKLDTCSFSGQLPESLGNLAKMTYLSVVSNVLTGQIPHTLGNAVSLSTLALANNDFTGTVPSQLGRLTQLEELHLQSTDLMGAMPQEVCDLRSRDGALLEVLFVPCDLECDFDTCCTQCS